MSLEAAWPVFIAAVKQAYELAKAERLAEFKGRRPRTFDDRGLHPYSEVWGYIGAATSPEIADWLATGERVELWKEITGEESDRVLSPTSLRAAAHAAATQEFVNEIIETGGFK